METENLNQTQPSTPPPLPVNLEEIWLRGSLKQIKALMVATVVIVASVVGSYWAFKSKDDLQDLQLETLKLQVEKVSIELHDLRTELNNKKDKTDK